MFEDVKKAQLVEKIRVMAASGLTGDEIKKSLSKEEFDLMKPESVDIEKGGKRAQLGEIREYSGRKYRKTVNGWEPVKEGLNEKKEEATDKKPEKTVEDKKPEKDKTDEGGKVDIKPMGEIDDMTLNWNYGRGGPLKQFVGKKAVEFLEAVFEFRKNNPPKGSFDTDTFSAERLADKNIGAYLHGIPKAAWKEYQYEWSKKRFREKWGDGIYSRLRTHDAYLLLKTNPLVGSDGFKPVDLSDFTKLVQLKLKY